MMETIREPSDGVSQKSGVRRREFLRLGAIGGAAVAAGAVAAQRIPDLRQRGLLSADGVFDAASIAWANDLYDEEFPTSPLILNPFSDELPVPQALRPEPYGDWTYWDNVPGPEDGRQNSYGNDKHQRWCDDPGVGGATTPLVYKIELKVEEHSFTSSKVLPINALGLPRDSFDKFGKRVAAGPRYLPPSTIYGFNGTFPGPMINAEYGKPALVRFVNKLGENEKGLNRQDFGAPDYSFLTHLHNAHTAPESDGNPHYSMLHGPYEAGYGPGEWCDNLYLNWPAGGDPAEKQSFFWFHDHRMDHTGANVYKGMVGLYPIYDPGFDDGDETNANGLRLPGRRSAPREDGSFDVDYDIPLAFFDVALDDGVTMHQDMHDSMGEYPEVGAPRKHPEWWGKTFFKHFPNHGFVGDLFTVNGKAYPVLHVERRKYRFRFLDCSVARIYDFQLMSSSQGPKAARDLGYTGSELQGQYRIPDGQQCMKFTEIATDGGLLPAPIPRDNFELWPAQRREVIIDFTKYQDGITPTTPGDVVYLTNVMKMKDGRMWNRSTRFSPDPAYKIPMLKFVIGDLPENTPDPKNPPSMKDRDKSEIPPLLRALPAVPANWKTMLDERMVFELQRGSGGGETEWLINGQSFDAANVVRSLTNPAGKTPLAQQPMGSYNLWEIRNGGGGWVHPMHLHMEEHRTMMRNGKVITGPTNARPDGHGKEDVIGLDPGESVIVFRRFRDFVGPYVAHCHNLAHEDHAMMFGWEIT